MLGQRLTTLERLAGSAGHVTGGAAAQFLREGEVLLKDLHAFGEVGHAPHQIVSAGLEAGVFGVRGWLAARAKPELDGVRTFAIEAVLEPGVHLAFQGEDGAAEVPGGAMDGEFGILFPSLHGAHTATHVR